MARKMRWLGSLGLGAALMYLLDPDRGRRRRALVRDQLASRLGGSGGVAGKTARDAANRARGIVAGARSRLRGEGIPDDAVLEERVRSRMGRHVSHPGSIEVEADQGRITLRGPVLAHEVDDLLRAVGAVRGVEEIDDRLEIHEEPGDVPGLQGGAVREGESFEYLQENWSPAARFLAGAVGGTMAIVGVRKLNALGAAALAVGAGLLTRGVTNKPIRRLTGIRAGRRAVDLQKTITVQAPVSDVYEFWNRVENFPRFMSHIREVRDLGDGRSRWTAAGPAGAPVTWNAVVTRQVPDEVLAWRSEPGSTIENAGVIHFEPASGEGTRIDIRMSYNPPAGAIGDAVAGLLGTDPRSAMDEDLVRFKSLIEEGRATAGGETVTREDLGAPGGDA
ncbi:MAG TPA: SRPBCC family protein [Gemmatimonadota bacterium]|nr:SRPBCC family protein [Gemmatimonadota bacterium]